MSGGTTPVINSTLIGILKVLKKLKFRMPGLMGFNDQFLNLSNLSQTKIRLFEISGSFYKHQD